jgi:prophage regulatory protein
MMSKLLRRPDVEALTGLAQSTLYDWMSKGQFPRPVRLGTRLVGWRESDVTAWISDRAKTMSEARNTVDSLGGQWFGSYGLCLCPAHRNARTPALSVGTGAYVCC